MILERVTTPPPPGRRALGRIFDVVIVAFVVYVVATAFSRRAFGADGRDTFGGALSAAGFAEDRN